MSIIVSHSLDGYSNSQLAAESDTDCGYVSLDQIESERIVSRLILDSMVVAAAEGDQDRLEYLDALYDEVMENINHMEEMLPPELLR
jgi:hypothetical protein